MNALKGLFIIASFFLSCEKDNSVVNQEPMQEQGLLDYVPENYDLILKDDFTSFNRENWSKGMTNDIDPTIRMIWNRKTGGEYLLNDSYAGYLIDENVYIQNGHLYLDNKKETLQGTDPVGIFDYTTGWINSLQKINFNGTQNSIYIEIKAKFPKGDKVWPAIWLIDDSEVRSWPPEIDIWEYFGKYFNTVNSDQMYMRFIYGKWYDHDNHSVAIENFQEDYNASDDWHIYGFQWTNNTMNWFINGEEVHTKTKGVQVKDEDWPNQPMCFVINNGLMTVVEEGNTVFPNSLVLDYLEVYQEN